VTVLDKPKSNCGVVAIYNHPEASQLAFLALYALQHRGQESAGIVSADGKLVYRHSGEGLVADIFSNQKVFDELPGHLAIGHNRYSTTGSTSLKNVQPILVSRKDGFFAVGHNGNLTNSNKLREFLENEGSLFQTSTDTEVICHLIARSRKNEIHNKIIDALQQLQGAFSLVLLTQDRIYAARDPHGVRPLCLGKIGDTYVVVSETCALDLLWAEAVRDIEPGELLEISASGIKSFRFSDPKPRFACIFEFVYFARPDSRIFNENVDKVRRKLGKTLALESPADADIVISVPDSSNTAAVGYSRRTNIKFELGLIRNHYVGRTFIRPKQEMRDFAVRIKFNPVKGVLKDRRIVVVEDSIVRATTLKQLVQLIRNAGASEIHVRVSSPPIIAPCFYGMDFPSKKELIANRLNVPEIRKFLECDSLCYLSHEGLLSSVPHDPGGYCVACFTGQYPIPIEQNIDKFRHE
jgi:amidophosphoribosyltransferase